MHQILAHDPKFSAATITNHFIDGLKDEIRAVVLVHNPSNLDTAASIALLQEETSKDVSRKDFNKHDMHHSFKSSHNGGYSSYTKGETSSSSHSKKTPDSAKQSNNEDKSSNSYELQKS